MVTVVMAMVVVVVILVIMMVMVVVVVTVVMAMVVVTVVVLMVVYHGIDMMYICALYFKFSLTIFLRQRIPSQPLLDACDSVCSHRVEVEHGLSQPCASPAT